MSGHDVYGKNRDEHEARADRNIFVIMRYGLGDVYKNLERLIRETVQSYGFEAVLAKDKLFWSDKWRNIEFFMQHARYGIVVLEQMQEPQLNPNVTVEMGYMLGLGKPCLLLRERSFHALPGDLLNQLYEPFDSGQLRKTVTQSIETWLRKLGHQKLTLTEVINPRDPIEAKKQRTERLLKALNEMKVGEPGRVLRQAGSLSSLAISEDETILATENPGLKSLLLDERKAVEELITSGVVVRCLISPFLQIASLQLKILTSEHVTSGVIPRFNRLCSFLYDNRDNRNVQFACTARLPHDNILIDESGCLVFLGKRVLKQWGLPHTTIFHDPNLVRAERDRFDEAFGDAAAACLDKSRTTSDDFGCRALKEKVIEHLEDCKRQLQRMTGDVGA
ncbi:MAG: hypothetical protein WA655_11910 [Candidatus Korobacteraceae bacterium]